MQISQAALSLVLKGLLVLRFGARTDRERRKVGKRKRVPVPWRRRFCWGGRSCSCSCSRSSSPRRAVPGAPPPRFTDLQNLGMWMAKIPWHKYMFADHISDHVLFIIMTCSETVCYSYVGLPWILFPLLVHWKQQGGGGGSNWENVFVSIRYLNSYFKKSQKGIPSIPRLGNRGERNGINKEFLKDQCNIKFWSGIFSFGCVGNDMWMWYLFLLNYLKIHPAKARHWIESGALFKQLE